MNTVEAQKTLAKRLLICFYAIVLVIGLVPINAWAEGDDAQDSTNQEQQVSQNEGESAGNSGEEESTEGSDSDKAGDTTADKSGDDTDSSADKSKESKSTEGSDSSASKGSTEDNGKSSASNESEENNDSSDQNSDDEESTNDSSENALESTGENGISLASVGDDQQPYLTYDHALTKQEVYDRLDTYYGFSPFPVHVYKATETGEQTGDELMTLAYYPWIDMDEKFPVDHYGLSRYYCRSTRFGWYGNIYLKEQVNVSSPEQSYVYDGGDHKWVPEVKATVNPNFSEDDYTVKYYRANSTEVETTDFTSPGNIFVRIRGVGDYSYFYSVKIYTIEAKDNLTVTGSDYEGYYDGDSHGEAAVPSDTDGTTVEYSTDGGENWSTTVPMVKNAGDSLKVDVRAHNDNYKNDATASYTLKVNKANINVLVAGDSKTDRTDPVTKEVIESNAVTYDGQQHSVQGFKVKSIKGESSKLYPESNVTLRDGVKAEAEGTDVGDYTMGLTKDSFVNPDPNFNVTYLIDDGVLTIKPAEVTVSVTGKSDTQTYNGAEQSVSGYEVTGIEGDQSNLYSKENVALAEGAAAEAKGTNAGTYEMGLTKDSFVNNDSNFTVSFKVTDGSLTIGKRALELNDSASLVYNGKEQVLNIDASKVSGLVEGDKLHLFNAQVKGTEPGTYNELSEYTWDVINDDLNVTKNYTLNVTGELTITEADTPASTDADSTDSSDDESSDKSSSNSSDAGNDSATPQTGDFAQFALGGALAVAIAALGAFLASRRIRGARR